MNAFVSLHASAFYGGKPKMRQKCINETRATVVGVRVCRSRYYDEHQSVRNSRQHRRHSVCDTLCVVTIFDADGWALLTQSTDYQAKIQDEILFNHQQLRRWWPRWQHFRNDALHQWRNENRIWYARLLQSMSPMKRMIMRAKKCGSLYSLEIWKDEWNQPKQFHFVRHLKEEKRTLQDFLSVGFILLRVCGRKENFHLWLTIVGHTAAWKVGGDCSSHFRTSQILRFATISHSDQQTTRRNFRFISVERRIYDNYFWLRLCRCAVPPYTNGVDANVIVSHRLFKWK